MSEKVIKDPYANPPQDEFLVEGVELDPAESVQITSADGETSHTVSRKAFDTVYAGRGFTEGKASAANTSGTSGNKTAKTGTTVTDK